MVHVRTVDDTAEANEDYKPFIGNIGFEAGEAVKEVAIGIIDDEKWEPDEDFFVELADPDTKVLLPGADTRCRVTIIDDDKPGQICFASKDTVKVMANAENAEVIIKRKNGSDGIVTVNYETVELDSSDRTATRDKDYTHVESTLTFQHGETEQIIKIPIKRKVDADGNEEVRDETFGLRLRNVMPEGAKLTKKNMILINIMTDVGKKKQEELFA